MQSARTFISWRNWEENEVQLTEKRELLYRQLLSLQATLLILKVVFEILQTFALLLCLACATKTAVTLLAVRDVLIGRSWSGN